MRTQQSRRSSDNTAFGILAQPKGERTQEAIAAMYQFSRAIYRDLARDIRPVAGEDDRQAHTSVLRACERTIERMATDRHYFKRPVRTLFAEVRMHFPMTAQARVWAIISSYVAYADDWLARQPLRGTDLNGHPMECRATTRRGTPCQRMPLPHNGYCPSQQHLAETENSEAFELAA
jgi:hypothetical protein